MSANLNGDISMSMSAEVLSGRILRAIEVLRSTLKGLPEGEGVISTFQVVTALTDVEEALLGMSDAPDTSNAGAIEPHLGPPNAVRTGPRPDAESVAPSIPASGVASAVEQSGDFLIGNAPESNETIEEQRPAEKLPGKHQSQTLADLARQKTQRFHAEREKTARSAHKPSKDDAEQTAAQRIRAAQRASGL
jgi:hypothetical protein